MLPTRRKKMSAQFIQMNKPFFLALVIGVILFGKVTVQSADTVPHEIEIQKTGGL